MICTCRDSFYADVFVSSRRRIPRINSLEKSSLHVIICISIYSIDQNAVMKKNLIWYSIVETTYIHILYDDAIYYLYIWQPRSRTFLLLDF